MSIQYAQLRRMELKADFDDTMITVVHTGSIQDQIFIKWLVSRQLNNILVFGINDGEGNEDMKNRCHRILFDGIELSYSADKKSDMDTLGKRIISQADNVTTDPKRNVIVLTKPSAPLIDAIHKYDSDSKSGIDHDIVINSLVNIDELNVYKDLYIISANSILNDETQKLLQGMPDKMPIDPLFFIYIILWMAKSPAVLQDIDILEEEEDGKTRFIVTLKDMEGAINALSYYVLGCFSG